MTAETNRSPLSIIDDSRMRLADDLDIAPDGKVYFSEATIRYGFEEWVVDALEGRGNGRIIRYDPATGATRTILRNLLFANGMCMAHDNKSVLFAETWGCSVSRLWLEGPKAGKTESVISDLPGYPDNINRGSRRTYWVAIAGVRTPAYDLAMTEPAFRRRMALRVAGDEWLFPNVNAGCVVHFDAAGRVLESLWDLHGKNHTAINSMREHRGYLYLGGVTNNRIGRIRLRRRRSGMDWPGILLGSAPMNPFQKAADRWLGRGDASITMPPMDGAFRPNDLLELAPPIIETSAPDCLAVTSQGIVVSSERSMLSVDRRGGAPLASFDVEISALAGLPDGGAAVGLIDGRIVFVGGEHGGKTIEASPEVEVHHRACACRGGSAPRRQWLGVERAGRLEA